MDAIEVMNNITLGARQNGMNLTDYLSYKYDTDGLDDILTLIKQEMSDNQKKIDLFRDTVEVRRKNFNIIDLDEDSLADLQQQTHQRLEVKRVEYKELCHGLDYPCSHESHEMALA